jgi:hypothetical protein
MEGSPGDGGLPGAMEGSPGGTGEREAGGS